MRAFLICPVRDVSQETTAEIAADIESRGWVLHWPPRDTNQNDGTGLRICRDNLAAIIAADVVFVAWDGKSQGCLFDLGMAFALNKHIVPIREMMPNQSPGKSFQNMVWALYQEQAQEIFSSLSPTQEA